MFSFRAYFWNNDVYIGEKHKYAANEILTAYLNTDYLFLVEDLLSNLTDLKTRLLVSEDMPYDSVKYYNKHVYRAMGYFSDIESWLQKLPPYRHWKRSVTLEDILNRHTFFFKDGLNPEEDIIIDEETFNEFGFGEKDDKGLYDLRLHKFVLKKDRNYIEWDADMRESLRELNGDISGYFDGYISFLNSYIAVHEVFRPFIVEYLHRKGTFPTDNETAEYFKQFNQDKGNAFQGIKCKMESFGYKVLADERHKPILCEEILFCDLQSFLFYDFFRGIKRNYIPNQCKQCGSFFLIRGGKYFSYCNNPLEDEPDKTCRDVGARRRYDDKCKNDPIWQTYNRAYKAHYARYMKKKMTVSEFETWSRFATEIRDKALAEEISFERYYADIRK